METRECIRIARKNAGLTQKALAEATGIAEITIRNYEAGKYNPKYEQLLKLASAMNVDIKYLIYGKTPQDYKDEHDSNLDKSKREMMKASKAATAYYEAYGFKFRLEGKNWIVTAPDGKEHALDPQARAEYGDAVIRPLEKYALYLHQKAIDEISEKEN